MSRLQEQVDLAQDGATLKLDPPGKEFEGPVIINRPLIIEGQGGTIWAREGPVVQINSSGVELRKLNVEVTSNETTLDDEAACALMVNDSAKITLNVVTIRGNVLGLDSEEGDWSYPRVLKLGKMKAGHAHEFKANLMVPVPCSLHSNIDGLHVLPKKIDSSGTVEITIQVDDSLAAGTLLRGEIELRTALLTRRINVSGNITKPEAAGSDGGTGQTIFDAGKPVARKPAQPANAHKPAPLPAELHTPPTMLATPMGDDASYPLPQQVVDAPPSPPVRSQAELGNERARPPHMSGGASIPVGPAQLTVSKMGDGDFRTIGEAIQNAQPGTRIQIRPGIYKESLIVSKDLELIGDGARSDIKIEADDGNCLRVQAKTVRVRGLSIRAAGRGMTERYAVAIPQGNVEIADCDITSDSLACVAVFGRSARLRLSGCKIHNGKSAGILFYDAAEGVIDDCDIYENAHAGIEIKSGANPVVRKCRIHHGRQVGILVHDKGKGSIEECDLHANAFAAVEIASGGAPSLRECKIHDGDYPGIRVLDKGLGAIESCDITLTHTGIEIKQGSKPVIRGCRISRSKQAGVLFCDKALGQIEDCKIFDNQLAGIEIRELSNPVITQCKIHGNGQTGIAIADKSAGTIEDCEIATNGHSGMEVREKAKPTVRRCQLHDNKQAGLLVRDAGTGTWESCQIHANGWAGVAIISEANPTLRRCEIRDGKHDGVVVANGGMGALEKCTITGNARNGIVIAGKGAPELQQCKIKRNKQLGLLAFDQAAGSLDGCEIGANDAGQTDIAGGCKVRVAGGKT